MNVVSTSQCIPSVGKDHSASGSLQVSTTDSEVTQAANFAAEQLSQQSNSLSSYKGEEVLSARSKVVSGKAFELKLKLSQGNLPEQIVQVIKVFVISWHLCAFLSGLQHSYA